MTLSVIVAMTEDGVIGRDNRLPWHLPEDLARFKEITMGHPIIMGRKTYESIGKPLPGRTNIVLTRNPEFRPAGVLTAGTLAEAMAVGARQPGGSELFVIGGAALFQDALPAADRVYLTLIHEPIGGNTRIPPIDLKRQFEVVERRELQGQRGDKLRFSYLTANRKLPSAG